MREAAERALGWLVIVFIFCGILALCAMLLPGPPAAETQVCGKPRCIWLPTWWGGIEKVCWEEITIKPKCDDTERVVM